MVENRLDAHMVGDAECKLDLLDASVDFGKAHVEAGMTPNWLFKVDMDQLDKALEGKAAHSHQLDSIGKVELANVPVTIESVRRNGDDLLGDSHAFPRVGVHHDTGLAATPFLEHHAIFFLIARIALRHRNLAKCRPALSIVGVVGDKRVLPDLLERCGDMQRFESRIHKRLSAHFGNALGDNDATQRSAALACGSADNANPLGQHHLFERRMVEQRSRGHLRRPLRCLESLRLAIEQTQQLHAVALKLIEGAKFVEHEPLRTGLHRKRCTLARVNQLCSRSNRVSDFDNAVRNP